MAMMMAERVRVSATTKRRADGKQRYGDAKCDTAPSEGRGLVLGVVCAVTAMLMVDVAVVNVSLGSVAVDLHARLEGLQWIIDAYTITLAATVISAGSLADRFGRRKLLFIGLSLFAFSSLACGLAANITMLDLARGLQGIGAALMFATSLAILAHAFPAGASRDRALAAYGATIGGAFAIAPLIGGILTSLAGWRSIFLLNVPIGAGCIGCCFYGVKESRDPNPRRLDVPGQALLAASLLLLVMALLRAPLDGWATLRTSLWLGGGLLLLGGFIAVERTRTAPMLPFTLFADRSFTGAQLAAFAISASLFAVFVYSTLYLQHVLRLSAIETGLVYLPATIAMFLGGATTATLVGRIPARCILSGTLLAVSAGMWVSLSTGVGSTWLSLLPGELIACLGAGAFNPTVSAVTLGQAPLERSGLATGVNDTFRQFGIGAGVAMMGTLMPAGVTRAEADPSAYVLGFHRALCFAGGIAFIGAIASWTFVRDPVRPDRNATPLGQE
jgi:EmrB/QacA subfamily drug resistance transporter